MGYIKSASFIPRTFYQAGRYFSGFAGDGTVSTGSMLANQLFYVPLVVDEAILIDRIGINVGTAQAGGEARIGIRRFTNKSVGKLVLDAGTVDCSTLGGKEIITNQWLYPGRYVGLLLNKVNSTGYTCYTQSPISGSNIGQSGVGTSFHAFFTVTGVTYAPFSADPEVGAPGSPNTFAPIISLRVAQ